MKSNMNKIFSMLLVLMMMLSSSAALAEDKQETVYALADQAGEVRQVIVTEKLTNPSASDTLNDFSTLQNIVSLSGQSFQLSEGALTWAAGGSEVRYQGTTEEELPVAVRIAYALDGEPIAPTDLNGKSGHLTITVSYETRITDTVVVNDETVNLPVPFLMATVVPVNCDTCANVIVTNGRYIESDRLSAAVVFGLPGAAEVLNLEGYEHFNPDMDLSATAVIEADVTNYHIESSYTIATNHLADLDLTGMLPEMDVSGTSEQLKDAMTQLLTGSSALADGASTLKDGADSLSLGLATIDANSEALCSGAEQITQAIFATANQTLAASAEQLAAAGVTINPLTSENYAAEIERMESELLAYVEAAVTQQAEAALTERVTEAVRAQVTEQVTAAVSAQVTESVTSAVQEQVSAQLTQAGVAPEQLEAALAQKMEGEEVQAMIAQNVEGQMGSDEVKALIQQNVEAQMVSEEVQALIAENIADQKNQPAYQEEVASAVAEHGVNSEAYNSLESLKAQLDSVMAFKQGVADYTGGVSQAAAGAVTLAEGAATLQDGADTLNTGLTAFNTDAVEKLTGYLDGDIASLLENASAMNDLMNSYEGYAGKAEGDMGYTLFVIKTDAQ